MKERKQCGNCVGIFSLLSESSTVLCVVLYGRGGGGPRCSLYSRHRASVTGPFISLQMELDVASVESRNTGLLHIECCFCQRSFLLFSSGVDAQTSCTAQECVPVQKIKVT